MVSESASSSYVLHKVLCSTYFGRVHLARNNNNTTNVVCKLSNRHLTNSSAGIGTLEDPKKEVDLLRKLQQYRAVDRSEGSNNIINFIEHFSDATHDWSVLEWAEQGDLYNIVNNSQQRGEQLSPSLVQDMFRNIFAGLHYLHNHYIVHRDLSLENFFVMSDGTVKIGDFGQAMEIEVDSEGNQNILCTSGERPGKTGYMAPEIIDQQPYNMKKADVFAVGVAMFIALTGIPPFERARSQDKCWKYIKQGRLHHLIKAWQLKVPELAVDLLQKMMNPENSRISLSEARSHPFFNADVMMCA
jgi:serine/threonine protein kinase